MTANPIHNHLIITKRDNGIRCQRIPKFLSKICDRSNPRNKHSSEHYGLVINPKNDKEVSNTKSLVNNLVTKTNMCATRKNVASATNINTVKCLAYSSFM